MEEKDKEWIEQYLAGELSEEEIASLESRMERDDAFRSEVELYRLTLKSLKLAKREELKSHFTNIDRLETKRFPWLLVGLVLIGIILILWYLKNTSSQPEARKNVNSILENPIDEGKKIILPADTFSIPVQKDTLQENKLLKKENGTPIAHKKNNEELYAMHFVPYKDESLNPSVRGSDVKNPYHRFIQYYWKGDYTEALKAFTSLSPSLQQNDNIRFIKANALIATNKPDEAADLLKYIIGQKTSRYTDTAQWYLGYCEWQMNQRLKHKEKNQ